MRTSSETEGILYSRRSAGLIFLVGVTMMAVLYLIRLDMTLAAVSGLGVESSIKDRITPILSQTVGLSVKTLTNDRFESAPATDLVRHQVDPRSMLTSLFGSSYSRSDYV
uniref:Wsv136-like protein n=1 Tax=Penaeus monodon endogenous nimavirus TaxID=2133795 RepID=A0A401IPK5_9VIRU|nr:MAG: wsv136-like protein [Penaeus monodon endogenous nimavirus]GBG35546.1 wsv136-like protein [Penaeus monodon endogenous nimavirus]